LRHGGERAALKRQLGGALGVVVTVETVALHACRLLGDDRFTRRLAARREQRCRHCAAGGCQWTPHAAIMPWSTIERRALGAVPGEGGMFDAERCTITLALMAAGLAGAAHAQEPAASSLRAVPAETLAAKYQDASWQPPRTSWGHPSFEGVWSTDDMRSVPLNRPERFGERQQLTAEEFAERAQNDEGGRDFSVNVGTFLRHEWGVRTFGYTSLVIDPPNGRVPALTPAGEALAATRVRGTFGPGPFNDFSDFNLYDRCITRGVLGSILPVIYGNGVRIAQHPGAVAISYEMIRDTRIVPLDGRPALDVAIRQYMGSARGRFEGDTLVVETTNFTDKTSIGTNGNGAANSEAMKLTERFRRVDPEMIEYIATVDDPVAFTAP